MARCMLLAALLALAIKNAWAENTSCPITTGGTCTWMRCSAQRNAECVNHECVCGAGKCAMDGKCVPAAEYDPSESCANNKPCGCSILRDEKESNFCINDSQCGSRWRPGICAV